LGAVAGLLYLTLLPVFGGRGGSRRCSTICCGAGGAADPVAREALRQGVVSPAIWLAMLCGGIAITMKQTPCANACSGRLCAGAIGGSTPGPCACCGRAGAGADRAAPMALCAAIYAAIGHFGPFCRRW